MKTGEKGLDFGVFGLNLELFSGFLFKFGLDFHNLSGLYCYSYVKSNNSKEDTMEEFKDQEKSRSIDTAKLIEISREVLRVARKLREEEEREKKPAKPLTPYEECVKNNPYISNWDKISYY